MTKPWGDEVWQGNKGVPDPTMMGRELMQGDLADAPSGSLGLRTVHGARARPTNTKKRGALPHPVQI